MGFSLKKAVKSVGHAVSQAAKSTVQVATAPAKAAVNIAQGKNVAQSLGQMVQQQATGLVNLGSQNPLVAVQDNLLRSRAVKGIASSITLGATDRYLEMKDTAAKSVSQGGYLNKSDSWQFTRGALVTGAAVAGVAYGAGALSGSQALTAYTGTRALMSGNIAGAAESAAGLAGFDVPPEVKQGAAFVGSMMPQPRGPSSQGTDFGSGFMGPVYQPDGDQGAQTDNALMIAAVIGIALIAGEIL